MVHQKKSSGGEQNSEAITKGYGEDLIPKTNTFYGRKLAEVSMEVDHVKEEEIFIEDDNNDKIKGEEHDIYPP